MNCSDIGNMVLKLKIFPTLASAKPKLKRNRPLLPGVRVQSLGGGEYGGERKKALSKISTKCLNLLERDTRFERATFSLGS